VSGKVRQFSSQLFTPFFSTCRQHIEYLKIRFYQERSTVSLCSSLTKISIHTALTPWSRVIPEKLTESHLLNKFSTFYETRRFALRFVTWLSFYGEELSAPRPTPKQEDNPLSAVRDYLFNIFAATLHIWKPFLHPQPEDAPCRGDRDPLIRVTRYYLHISHVFKVYLHSNTVRLSHFLFRMPWNKHITNGHKLPTLLCSSSRSKKTTSDWNWLGHINF
jgi:hypothetical protein